MTPDDEAGDSAAAHPPDGDAALQREALRLCDRYVAEVVLGFGLCPWAEAVLRAGTLARRVLVDARVVPADVLPIIDAWAAGEAEIGFVIFPRYAGSRGAFDSFAEGVRRADRARRVAGAAGPFMIAAFHPQGAEQFVGPHQLVSFLRRSPDPLLQLVRAERLERVKSLSPDVSNQIAERNHTAMTPVEAERFNATVRAIRGDRDEAYARLALG